MGLDSLKVGRFFLKHKKMKLVTSTVNAIQIADERNDIVKIIIAACTAKAVTLPQFKIGSNIYKAMNTCDHCEQGETSEIEHTY